MQPHRQIYNFYYVCYDISTTHAQTTKEPPNGGGLIPPHGGYRKLKSFQMAELCFDVTVRFCKRCVDRRRRTRDQMVQAARSGTQNIVEGSAASGTSKKTALKLTDTARFSLEELRRDYRDYLRQRRLKEWSYSEPLRQELIDARCASAEEVAQWVREVRSRLGHNGRRPTYSEIAANAALVLIAVACSLLDRQLASLRKRFLEDGGFTERMYRMRSQRRRQEPPA
jgi:four helix bundle suffix protein